MIIWCNSSSYDAYKSCRPGRYDASELTLHSAKNARARGIIFLRDYAEFTVNGVEFPSAPDGIGLTFAYQSYITYNDGTPYPDPISQDASVNVKVQTAQGIWICAEVGKNAQKGLYRLSARVKTTAGDFDVPVALRVYGVTVPDADKGVFSLEYFLNVTDLPEKCGRRWSAEWYTYLEKYAQSLTDIRNNCLDISAMVFLADAGSRRTGESEWALDFSKVGEYIDFMTAHAEIKLLSIRSIIACVMGDTIPYFDYDGSTKSVKYTEPLAAAWAKAYYGGLYEYFRGRGQLPILQFRLQDEPHYPDCWRWAREMCRKYAPGVVCGEPLDTHSTSVELEGYCDQYIPRINVYEEGADFYKRMQEKGAQVWVYSCCFPEESWYMNKFIDQPHRYSRLMSWACFAQGITGFLHWGYNYWSETSIYGTSPEARFKGDGFVVYYDGNGGLLPSARSYATYEGIIEYELLSIAAKKRPAAAKALALSVCRTFTDFERGEKALDDASLRLLQLAEECADEG